MNKNDKIDRIKSLVEQIAVELGLETTPSNKDTPYRVAKMYVNELFKNANNENIEELYSQMKLFDNEGESLSPITITVPFNSICEHHWLPFMGNVTVTYIPKDKIIGLSKIPRVVDFFSRKPQLQERLTTEIGEYLVSIINPEYLSVKMVATHTCVSIRGAKSPCETTTTYEYKNIM